MDAGLTIHEAAQTTGWSPRMLRYVERTGLVTPARSPSGYRLYGPAQLQRLRTLKELLAEFEIGLSDVAFAARLAVAASQPWTASRSSSLAARRAANATSESPMSKRASSSLSVRSR